jgi:hypothetical protein
MLKSIKQLFSVLLLIVIGSIGFAQGNVDTHAASKKKNNNSWSWNFNSNGAFSWNIKVYECKKPLNPTTPKLGGLCVQAYWAWK